MLEVVENSVIVDLSNQCDYFEQRKWMIIDEYLQDLLKLDADDVIEDEEGCRFKIRLRDRMQALMFKRLLEVEFEKFDRDNKDYFNL